LPVPVPVPAFCLYLYLCLCLRFACACAFPTGPGHACPYTILVAALLTGVIVATVLTNGIFGTHRRNNPNRIYCYIILLQQQPRVQFLHVTFSCAADIVCGEGVQLTECSLQPCFCPSWILFLRRLLHHRLRRPGVGNTETDFERC
jgi:hypothetical protein